MQLGEGEHACVPNSYLQTMAEVTSITPALWNLG